jgi:hypothetical protein
MQKSQRSNTFKNEKPFKKIKIDTSPHNNISKIVEYDSIRNLWLVEWDDSTRSFLSYVEVCVSDAMQKYIVRLHYRNTSSYIS